MNRSVLTGLTRVVIALAIIGALNWGLVGFFNWNLVTAIFGGSVREEASTASRLVYALVGIAGLAAILLVPWLPARSKEPKERLPTGPASVRP